MMKLKLPALSTVILVLPGGVIAAAGLAAPAAQPEVANNLMQALVIVGGTFASIVMGYIGQRLIKLQKESASVIDVKNLTDELGELKTENQTFKQDLRVTTLEKNSAIEERDELKVKQAALIQQHTTEMQQLEKRHTDDKRQWEAQYKDLKAEVEQLKQWKASRESMEVIIDHLTAKLFAGMEQSIERLIALAKLSTSERKAVAAGELKPAT